MKTSVIITGDCRVSFTFLPFSSLEQTSAVLCVCECVCVSVHFCMYY